MNSLIVFPHERVESTSIVLGQARAQGVYSDYQGLVGRDVKFAFFGGERGVACVKEVTPSRVVLRIETVEPSLPLRRLDLIVGLSRPQTVKKVIQAAVMLGVRSLHFVHTDLGDKSYLDSSVLKAERLREEVVKALEQVYTGLYPEISVHRSFEYYCKTKINELDADPKIVKLVAHPGGALISSQEMDLTNKTRVVALGPERGWSEREIDRLARCGFKVIGLGDRVVRVEIALISILAQLQIFESEMFHA